MSVHSQDNKPGFGFKLFKAYIRFFHGKIFYKKTYWLHTERIPAEGPLMVVSDHQNGLSDVLGVLMSIDRRRDKRKVRVVARADVFKPAVRKALHWLGLIPAYRLAFDGEASLSNNAASFEDIEQELLLDGTVVIYPEAGHQDKHWLGQFSLAYLHILFEAARKTGFQKEMFVLPSCNHYSDYFHAREKMLLSAIQYIQPKLSRAEDRHQFQRCRISSQAKEQRQNARTRFFPIFLINAAVNPYNSQNTKQVPAKNR